MFLDYSKQVYQTNNGEYKTYGISGWVVAVLGNYSSKEYSCSYTQIKESKVCCIGRTAL